MAVICFTWTAGVNIVFVYSIIPPLFSSSHHYFLHRNTWKAATVTLVIMVTTPWSIETPWAVCRVHVTSVAPCQDVHVIYAPDNAHAERGWRGQSAPTVPTTSTTGVQTWRVRGGCCASDWFSNTPLVESSLNLLFYCSSTLTNIMSGAVLFFNLIRGVVSELCAMYLWPQRNSGRDHMWQHHRAVCLCPYSLWTGLQ